MGAGADGGRGRAAGKEKELPLEPANYSVKSRGRGRPYIRAGYGRKPVHVNNPTANNQASFYAAYADIRAYNVGGLDTEVGCQGFGAKLKINYVNGNAPEATVWQLSR